MTDGIWTNPAEVHRDVRDLVRFGHKGVWRAETVRPTPAQLAILRAMVGGAALIIDQAGDVRLSTGQPVHPQTFRALVERRWVEPPLAELPLLQERARPGVVTDCGRAAATRNRV
jgi:hypothetical protein